MSWGPRSLQDVDVHEQLRRVVEPLNPPAESAPAQLPHEWRVVMTALEGIREQLVRMDRAPKERHVLVAVVGGQTNSSGDLVLPVHQVRQGFTGRATRTVVEAAGYTAASPYTSASCSITLGVSSNPGAVAQGGVVDWAPVTAGSQALPALQVDDVDQAPFAVGGQYYVVTIDGGPASTMVTVRMQVIQELSL